MNKDPSYVKCKFCEYQLEDDPLKNWNKYPCTKCNNSRMVLNPKDILCNMCGESMCELNSPFNQDPLGLYKADVIGCYDSYHLLDMNQYIFSFCEKCLRDLFIKCKIPPTIYDTTYVFNNATGLNQEKREEIAWAEDLEIYEFTIWRDTGGHRQAYLNGTCNAVKNCNNKAAYTKLIDGEFTEDCCCEDHKKLFNFKFSELTKFIPQILRPFL